MNSGITAVFYIVSFMTGGAAIAFIFASGCSGAVSNGIFYIGERVYFFMILGAGAAAGYDIRACRICKRL